MQDRLASGVAIDADADGAVVLHSPPKPVPAWSLERARALREEHAYVRTRAGTRYLELFQEEEFVDALNIAKWQIWLTCFADLAVYAGTLIFRHGALTAEQVTHLMRTVADEAMAAVGTPADAGPAFADGVRHVQSRLDRTDWSSITDDEQAFCESPGALVEWAPVVDELKQYDTEIVENSMRFRWHEIRRNLRRDLDIEAVIAPLLGHSGPPPLVSGGDRPDQIH